MSADRRPNPDITDAAEKAAKALDGLEARPRRARSAAANLVIANAEKIKAAHDRGHSYVAIAKTMSDATGIRVTDKNLRRILKELAAGQP
ncbi:MAG: hypothetical protein KAY22_04430 [Rhizorhabdus sp.]|uniref:hypothetical protein n=1 Tax=Rhizorhabdus sp. TaxID=1968843 RepID=UPI001B3D6ED8|nr:hypothetical protein [Rhizorhabdus sp.]MBP8231531.1 hypothetical protein [Rhizorhabdus sp.]